MVVEVTLERIQDENSLPGHWQLLYKAPNTALLGTSQDIKIGRLIGGLPMR
jgi:hypothetical protein